MSERMLHTPRGVRDLLPAAAREKAALERRLADHFARWGYEPVVTPTFEFMDVLRAAVESAGASDELLYRFVDREGQVLALRPELTVPVARLVASRLQDAPKPLRLHYTGSVFRYDEPQSGRLREFTQAGVELIGAAGPEADAEVVAVTVSALTGLGLTGFRMDLGHVGFAAAVLDGLGLVPEAKAAVRRALLAQDYVALEETLAAAGASDRAKEDVRTLIALRGDASVLERAGRIARSEAAERSLANVTAVYRELEDYGVAGWVRIDLSMLKHLDYYTGVVVEGYTSDMGFALCTGGRYDRLLGRFGYDAPATGLAVGVERLLLALSRAGVAVEAPSERIFIAADRGRRSEAYAAAQRLRAAGFVAEVDVLGLSREQALRAAEEKGITRVALFAGAPRGLVEWVVDGRTQFVPPQDLPGTGGERA